MQELYCKQQDRASWIGHQHGVGRVLCMFGPCASASPASGSALLCVAKEHSQSSGNPSCFWSVDTVPRVASSWLNACYLRALHPDLCLSHLGIRKRATVVSEGPAVVRRGGRAGCGRGCEEAEEL
jgi:hypothetical protein